MKKAKEAREVLTHLKQNSETSKEVRHLHELLPGLSDEGILAIYFRFWERLLIEDIANILECSWNEADKLIEDSIKQLRAGFLNVNGNYEQQLAA